MRRASSCPRIQTIEQVVHRRQFTLFEFIWGELYQQQHDTILSNTQYNSHVSLAQVPLLVEKVASLGTLICFSLVLDFVILLPIRTIIAIVRKLVCGNGKRVVNFELHYAALIIPALISAAVLVSVDISWLYHSLRGRSVMSLFLYFHVSYVSEKIFANFGVDFFPFTYQKFGFIAVFEFIGLIIYAILHSLAVFLTIISLHAAMNSMDASFIAIICSSNFIELKGSVLKRFSAENVFQILCNDIVERFQHIFFGLLILLQTIVNDGNVETVCIYIGSIIGMEILVDSVKHIFLLKFNGIPASVFRKYKQVLCKDWSEGMISSTSAHDRITSRIGFVALPYVALVYFKFAVYPSYLCF
jgi:hypothetical protein